MEEGVQFILAQAHLIEPFFPDSRFVGIEHFIGSAEAGFGQRTDVHMAHRDQTVQEILFFFRVGLMNNTLVAVAGGTGLIGVNSRNQDQAVGYLVVDFCKTVDIIADRILVICRAGTDDD